MLLLILLFPKDLLAPHQTLINTAIAKIYSCNRICWTHRTQIMTSFMDNCNDIMYLKKIFLLSLLRPQVGAWKILCLEVNIIQLGWVVFEAKLRSQQDNHNYCSSSFTWIIGGGEERAPAANVKSKYKL